MHTHTHTHTCAHTHAQRECEWLNQHLSWQHCDESADCEGCTSSSSMPARSISSATCHQSSVLSIILNNNSGIQELELLAVNFHSAIHKNKIINPKTQQFGPWYDVYNCISIVLFRDNQLELLKKPIMNECLLSHFKFWYLSNILEENV